MLVKKKLFTIGCSFSIDKKCLTLNYVKLCVYKNYIIKINKNHATVKSMQ